jgi:hypothetical protein
MELTVICRILLSNLKFVHTRKIAEQVEKHYFYFEYRECDSVRNLRVHVAAVERIPLSRTELLIYIQLNFLLDTSFALFLHWYKISLKFL